MNTIFATIDSLEKKKWEFLESEKRSKIEDFMGLNYTSLMKTFDRKQEYSGAKFVYYQSNGENLLPSCWFYLTFNLLFVIIVFIVLNILFRILFNYRISQLIRPFSLWGYIGVVMLDGNMQIMYFLMFSQSHLLFSFDYADKMANFVSTLVFYIFLMSSVGCYFLYYIFYKRLSKYFLDNVKCSLSGVFVLTICSPLRQLALSAINNFLRNEYEIQLLSLMAVEICYISILVFFQKHKKTFLKLHVVSMSLSFSLIRVLFNLCLYFQQRNYETVNIFSIF